MSSIKIKKDKTKEMEIWSKILKYVARKVNDVKMVMVSANNNHAGFGLINAKLFTELMNLNDHI